MKLATEQARIRFLMLKSSSWTIDEAEEIMSLKNVPTEIRTAFSAWRIFRDEKRWQEFLRVANQNKLH